MNSIFELSRPIEAFRKEGKFHAALDLFKTHKNNFTKEQISQNIYLISEMITCLRKTDQFDAAFKFMQIYDIEISPQSAGKILSAYGWLLYSKYKAENLNLHQEAYSDYFEDDTEETESDDVDYHYNKSELLIKIEELILMLVPLNNKFNDTLISNLFGVVLKSEKKKPTPNWKLINDFCNVIDPNLLSKETSTIDVPRKGVMKEMELASDYENWYSYKTKALSKLGFWQECLDLSTEALENVEKPHYSNDVWFSRRLTLAKKNLGNTEDTIKELEKLLQRKREWFIQKELAELYLEDGQTEKAFKLGIDAMNNFGPIEFKVHLLFLIGKILNLKGDKEMAFKHFSLSKMIRESGEWKIPQALFNELNAFNQNAIPLPDMKKLQNELQNFWDSFSDRPRAERSYKSARPLSNPDDTHEGKIERIIHDNEKGKVGFIKSEHSDYYFSLNPYFSDLNKIKPGVAVRFKVQLGKNGKEQARIVKVLSQ